MLFSEMKQKPQGTNNMSTQSMVSYMIDNGGRNYNEGATGVGLTYVEPTEIKLVEGFEMVL